MPHHDCLPIKDIDRAYAQKVQNHLRLKYEAKENEIQRRATFITTQDQKLETTSLSLFSKSKQTRLKMSPDENDIVKDVLTKAARRGDNKVVKNVFKNCKSEDERSQCVETVINECIHTNDTGLISYITRRYRIALNDSTKLLKLRDPLAILYECVHKNNSVLAKVITDSSVFEYQTTLQKTYEHLLMTAIEKGCDVSLIGVLDTLWRRSLGNAKSNDCILEYKKLLVQIRDFSEYKQDQQIYLYMMIELELIKFDKKIGMEFLNLLPHLWLPTFQNKLRKSIDSSFTQKHYLSYILDKNGTIDEYVNWNNDRKQFSSRPGYIGISEISDYDVLTGVMDAIDRTSFQSAYETLLVKNAVERFMHALCNMISAKNPELKCSPRLVGSASEETRSFFPDEFDYLIIFERLAKQLNVNELLGQFLLEMKADVSFSTIDSLFDEYEGVRYLNPYRLKEFHEPVDKPIHAGGCS